jgi:hypothetical protein
MLFSSLALLAIQLKAQGLNPSQVLFADALVTLSPFDYRHVPKLDSKESMDLDQCIDNSSNSESDCSVLIRTTKEHINSPSKKPKVATPIRPAKVWASPRSPATTAPLSISCSSWPPSLGFSGPRFISVNSDSGVSNDSVINLLSDTKSEVEEVNNRSDSLSVVNLCRESTPVVKSKSLDTTSSINELRIFSDKDLDSKTAFSLSMEKIVSQSNINVTFLSPLVARYKRILDTHDQELTLKENKEACRKNDPKFIAKNQEKEDREEARRKRREKYHSSEYSKKR